MKKLLLFAVALLGLVACNNRENEPIEPSKTCTLTATIDLDQAQAPGRMIAPGTVSGNDLNMVWNENDQITISNGKEDPQVFKIVNSSINCNTAEFTGDSLQDMSSYTVTYGTASDKVQYYEGTCHPAATGTGTGKSITINSYQTVLKLQLTGAINVTHIKYLINDGSAHYNLKTTLDISNGITLNSEVKTVYFPVTDCTDIKGYAKLEFWNEDGKIKEQELPCVINKGHLIPFAQLDVRGYIEIFFKNGTLCTTLQDTLKNKEDFVQLVAKFMPGNKDATNIEWSSSNSDVLTVTSKGVVKQICENPDAQGNPQSTATITCTDVEGVYTKDTCTFTKGCFAAGTRIMMADGSVKKVEDIVEGDLIRTFDHEAGCISSAKVCLTYKGESKAASLDLTFASGKKLSIVGTHDLLLENTRKYVRINSGNVASSVGKRFYNAESGKWDKLVSYKMGTPVDYYCIYSAKHLNCIAEGLLTCPDDVDFNLNIYELDKNLKADAAQLNADIAKYGLVNIAKDFPEFAEYKDQMEDLGCQYVYIAIGKGLVPTNYIEQMKSYWRGE